jgi:hypothetical protein
LRLFLKILRILLAAAVDEKTEDAQGGVGHDQHEIDAAIVGGRGVLTFFLRTGGDGFLSGWTGMDGQGHGHKDGEKESGDSQNEPS